MPSLQRGESEHGAERDKDAGTRSGTAETTGRRFAGRNKRTFNTIGRYVSRSSQPRLTPAAKP